MYIFRDFRLENCTKSAFYAIFRHFLTNHVHRCAIKKVNHCTVRDNIPTTKKQATPKLESGLPDKDLQNAYALAFTVFQISVYLSSRASDV